MSHESRFRRVRRCSSRTARASVPFVAALLCSTAPGSSRAEADEIRFELPGAVPLLALDYGRDGAPTVTIRDGHISPLRIELRPGMRVAWKSVSSETMRISFPRGVAREMRCTSVVNFTFVDDRLESGRLAPGETAHFCPLEPGTYRFRVERDRLSQRRGGLSDRMRGTIVVADERGN
jgi:hypothetical protein